jgi:Family of unknown function (DUF6288)
MDNLFQKNKVLNSHATILLGVLVLATADAAAVKDAGEMLGPTGIRGLIQTWPPPPKEYIEVMAVEKSSPADGKVNVGDVIVGFGTEKIKGYPQPMLAKAIDDAETEAAGGNLILMLKSGKQAVIPLPVLGTYSATAPYNCPKSEKIINQTLEALLKEIEGVTQDKRKPKKYELMPTKTALLGLMATGEKKYIDLAGKLIKESDMLTVDPVAVDDYFKGGKDLGTVGWYWGYNLITLGEYYLLTKDESVLPAMKTYALGLARGQDASGCWGHRMAINGRFPGYAQMNQPSITDFMGMIYAKKCGIKDPVLDKAIQRSYDYVADHAYKGCFPYGVGGPDPAGFNNNGTSGSAAICMSLMGDQKAAAYFSQIAATAYDGLTSGHANTFFNPLWTSLGAALSGPEVTQQFFKKSLWYYNAKRNWRGGFPGSNGTAGAYVGQALLLYCLPRKALLITGREADPSIWAKGEAVNEIIMRSKLVDDKKSLDELLKLLDYPFTQVPIAVQREVWRRLKTEGQTIKNEEAKMLKAKKAFVPKESEIVPKILAVIATGTPLAKANAIACFGGDCPSTNALPQAEKLGAIVRDRKEALSVRIAAAAALGSRPFQESKAAYPYYNDALHLVDEPRTEKDPFNHTDVKIAEALDGMCGEPFKEKVVVEKDLLYKVALRFMDHKRQKARAVGTSMLRGIPLEDFHRVADKLVHVLDNDDLSYQSYHAVHETLAPGVEVLAGLNIKEGLDMLMKEAIDEPGKAGFKAKMIFAALPRYGSNAKPYVATLKESKLFSNVETSRFKGSWDAMVKTIEEDKNPKKLITLEEAKAAGKK